MNPQRKKIIHIITRLDLGGSAEDVILICRNLDPAKYDVLLVYGGSKWDPALLPFRSADVPELKRDISLLHDLRALGRLYSLIKREKPDIVQTHSSKAGFLGRLAAKCAGVKCILHNPHGHIFYGYGFNRIQLAAFILFERIAAALSTRIIAITEGEKKETLEKSIGKRSQWVVIHSAVEHSPLSMEKARSIREQFDIPADATIVGTVARFERVKGIPVLIDAAALLKNRTELLFLLVGDGSERALLENKIAEFGLQRQCRLTGIQTDVADFMAAMDIYVQPSLNEGMGKTIVQAQMLGKPVIASRVQGIPDVVLDGKTGMLVPPHDPRALASAIAAMISDTERRQRMGSAAQAWVNEQVDGHPRFSLQRKMALLNRLYESLDGSHQ